MLVAYVDFKKAFDSVHREALWDLLRFRRISAGIIGLLSSLYSGTKSVVNFFFGGEGCPASFLCIKE